MGLQETTQPAFPGNLLSPRPRLPSRLPHSQTGIILFFFFFSDILQKSGVGKVAAPSLPCEGVPYNYQAVGPFVGRGDPPPVFTDAEAGDHVKVALQGRRGSALKHQGCGRTERGTSRRGRGPKQNRAPFQARLAGGSYSHQPPRCLLTAGGLQTFSPSKRLKDELHPLKHSGCLGDQA